MVIENKNAYKSNTRWTAIDLERAIHLKNQGVTHQVIAESLGRSVKSVDVKLHKWAKSMKEASDNAVALANKEPFDLYALVDSLDAQPEIPAEPVSPVRAKPKYYLRHVTFENKEDAKAMGALWDGMCWFIPNHVTGDAREALASKYGPVCYGNHSARGKGQWDVFVFADGEPDAEPTPGRVDVKAKPKAVTQKKVQPVVEATGNNNVATGNNNVATGNSTDAHVFIIRIPKRLVWGVLVSVLVAAAWYVGKTY
jgi:hypothetical protein